MSSIASNQGLVRHNAWNGMLAAGTVAMTAGAVSQVATLGRGIASSSQNVVVGSLCQRVSSSAGTAAYGALGIMTALTLVYGSEIGIPRDQELFELMPRGSAHVILGYLSDDDEVLLNLLKLYPDNQDVREAAAPALLRLRMRQLQQWVKLVVDGATVLSPIGEDAMIAAATGLGFRIFALAYQIALLQWQEKPWTAILDGEALEGRSFASFCTLISHLFVTGALLFPNRGKTFLGLVSGILPVLAQLNGRIQTHPSDQKRAGLIKIISVLISTAILLGANEDRILGNNHSPGVEMAIMQSLRGSIALAIVGGCGFYTNCSQNLASRSLSNASKQAIRTLAHQLLQCGIKHMLIGGSTALTTTIIYKERDHLISACLPFFASYVYELFRFLD